MKEILESLFTTLNSVLPGQVSYGKKDSIDESDDYIIYQEVSNRGSMYADEKVTMRILTIQLNLITKHKTSS